ncbi:MAG TPA: hypothetical protein VF062_29335 [Candidatus Limnocylindrales bacterium]
MRTNRLSRWIISGALVAAGVAAGFGGQTAASGMGVQTLAVETQDDGDTAVAPTTEPEQVASPASAVWDWQ